MLAVLGLLVLGAGSFAAFEYLTLPSLDDVGALAKKDPPTTALIEHRAAQAREKGQKARRRQLWVGLSGISPRAVDAVVLSEDAGFYQHDGVDVQELEQALREAWDRKELGRGASTITQQLAKNLWLSNDRSVLRKAKELVLARRLEEALPKKRILALYLNVAEWGDGVYGIEAAAREHFGASATELTVAQGAVLASMLPAPRRWTPSRRSPTLHRRSLRAVDHLLAAGRIDAGQAGTARTEIDAILGAGDATADVEDEEEEE